MQRHSPYYVIRTGHGSKQWNNSLNKLVQWYSIIQQHPIIEGHLQDLGIRQLMDAPASFANDQAMCN
uniref:Uncharacterized protein n=1 Tax=Romanomermis culicivorax TaxID=13658 RepID=A0A915JG97_ROMCU